MKTRRFLFGLLLVLSVALVYWPVGGYPFVNFDDNIYVYNNPCVLGGLTAENVAWAFHGFHANFWHPLVWLSLMLDRSLFGPGPAGFHAMNVAYHTANALLLWLALSRMTGAQGRSFAVAALWALHPLRVESVAWITERKDTLSGLFFLLTLLAYASYAARPTRWRYAGVLGLFALGLMAKPMLVTLPVLLLMLDAWPLRRWRSSRDAGPLILEKAPLLALALVAAAAAFVAQDTGGALAGLDAAPWPLRAATAIRAAARYTGNSVWPVNLCIFYPYDKHPGLPAVAAAAGALVALTALAFWRVRRQPSLAVGWAWFIVSLFPVCGIVQVGGFAAADRFTYLPSIGLILAMVWLAADALPPRGHVIAVAAAGLALAWGSSRQVTVWRSSRALFDHALAVSPDNWLAHHNVGHAELAAGNADAAQAHFRAALRINPASGEAHDALAYILRRAEDREGAVFEYLAAARAQPGQPTTRYNLGAALAEAGRLESAARAFRCASRLDPGLARAREALGNTLLALDRPADAIPEYETALRLDPANPRVPENLRLARERDKPAGVRY